MLGNNNNGWWIFPLHWEVQSFLRSLDYYIRLLSLFLEKYNLSYMDLLCKRVASNVYINRILYYWFPA